MLVDGYRVRSALLVPCYNAVRFLPRLRKQVDRLSPSFDEVLLADDGSTDDTAEVAEMLGFQLVRLSTNRGPGAARNILARAATAEWIHFHDVDDELAANYLSEMKASRALNADIVFHFVDFIEEETRKLIIRWDFSTDNFKKDPQVCLLRNPMPTVSSFMRRELFLEAGGFDEELRCFEDSDFHFRLALNGANMMCLPKVLEWSLRHAAGAGANQHYCFKCRLSFLERYAANVSQRLHHVVAAEAERAATMLLREGDAFSAGRAIKLAQQLGRPVPSTNNAPMKLLSYLLPTPVALKLQDAWRRYQAPRH